MGECQSCTTGTACSLARSSSCLVLVWPWALTSLEKEGAPGNATLPCASHLGGHGGVGIVAPGVEGQFARPPIFLAAARSISGGKGPPDLGIG